MKRITLFLLVGLIMSIASCTEETPIEKEITKIDNERQNVYSQKVRFRFVLRWPDMFPNDNWTCPCPNCAIPNCPCPGGVCISIGFGRAADPISGPFATVPVAEIGYGDISADPSIGKIKLEFEQSTAVDIPSIDPDEKFIYISDAYDIPASLCADMDITSASLVPGTYVVDFSSNPYGDVELDAVIVD